MLAAVVGLAAAARHGTLRGGVWSTRAARGVLRNDDYLGSNGYPALITQALGRGAGAAQPHGSRRGRGAEGRPSGDDDALLAAGAFRSGYGADVHAAVGQAEGDEVLVNGHARILARLAA